ncbi:MAG: thiamine diphosphokinase [Eubacteriales bacterium]|nr:thiamine diphosphokinase [Eubacteriales bacterium]
MHTLIISGGRIEEDFALTFLKDHSFDYIIAADKGLEFAQRAQLIPNLIVGDFDSSDRSLPEQYETQGIEVHYYKPQKDATDMEIAMEAALEAGSTRITVLGATGTRMDHVLGSIKNLTMAAEKNVEAELVDSHNRIRLLNHGIKIRKSEQYGHYVSLLAHAEEVRGLTLKGFFYPLKDYCLTADSALGVSNEITEEVGEISFSSGRLLLIESRD